jgi:uncharacterized protein
MTLQTLHTQNLILFEVISGSKSFGLEILSKGTLNIRVFNREELLSIKAGNMEYNEILQMADELILSIEKSYENTHLQDVPDYEKAIKNLVEMRKVLYS